MFGQKVPSKSPRLTYIQKLYMCFCLMYICDKRSSSGNLCSKRRMPLKQLPEFERGGANAMLEDILSFREFATCTLHKVTKLIWLSKIRREKTRTSRNLGSNVGRTRRQMPHSYGSTAFPTALAQLWNINASISLSATWWTICKDYSTVPCH